MAVLGRSKIAPLIKEIHENYNLLILMGLFSNIEMFSQIYPYIKFSDFICFLFWTLLFFLDFLIRDLKQQ